MDDPTSAAGAPEPTNTPTTPVAGPSAPARSRRRWITAALVAGVVLLALVLVDRLTASPALCISCHDMDERVASWAESAHATTDCVACHTAPTAWYQLPQRLVGKTRLLGRDVYWKATGAEASAEESVTGIAAVKSGNCLECHDANREATSGFRILIDHAEHAERNGSCISCHVNTAHPEAQRGTAISLMSQCFTCHGTPEQPKASAECGVCHPNEYELRPASHKEQTWKAKHGTSALGDPAQCRLCHDPQFCTSCHGVTMPHPAGWAKGPTGHAVFAEEDRAVCVRCHDEKPDFCSMCHHTGYDPAKGSWEKQHFIQVRREGTTFCMKCHSPLYCVECHAEQGE